MKLSDETSGNLRALSFLCALLVVPIHCWSEATWFAGTEIVSTFEVAVKLLFSCSFSRIAVPFFFVMTGFFLALNFKPTIAWYMQMLKKRTFTIYLPFVIWNAMNVALCLAIGKEGYREMGAGQLFAMVFGWNLWERVGCSQFWYLQTIMVWMLVSPLALLVLKQKILAVLTLAFLIWGWAVNLLRYPHPLAVGNFLWLSIGTVAAFAIRKYGTVRYAEYAKKVYVKVFVAVLFGVAVAGRVASGLHRDINLYDVFDKLLISSGLAALFLNMETAAKLLGRLRSVWGLSFFVYAFHSMLISVVVIAIPRFGMSPFAGYCLKLTVAVVGTIATGWLFRRWLPRCFAVLTGGRGL